MNRMIALLASALVAIGTPVSLAAAQSGAGCCATRGYIGLSFDGPNVEERRDNERLIRFLAYPRIALVEPGSPAERAGVAEGDTLLALNGSDVRDSEFALRRLLVPGRRLSVRVRRDGNPVDFLVVVARAPDYVMSRMMPQPRMPAIPQMPRMPRMPQVRVRVDGRVQVPPVPDVAALAEARDAAERQSFALTWVMQDGVAGARLESVNEGLGKALGTKYGVLVLRSAPGSPAYESGLRDGDVILRAGRSPVRSVRELRRTLEVGDGDAGVRLTVLREHRQREITLRW